MIDRDLSCCPTALNLIQQFLLVTQLTANKMTQNNAKIGTKKPQNVQLQTKFNYFVVAVEGGLLTTDESHQNYYQATNIYYCT